MLTESSGQYKYKRPNSKNRPNKYKSLIGRIKTYFKNRKINKGLVSWGNNNE